MQHTKSGADTGNYFGLGASSLETLGHILRKFPAIEQVIIYGSRAMGTYHEGSDIDLALLGPNVSRNTILELADMLDDSFIPYKIDLLLYSSIKNAALKEHIDTFGKEFYLKKSTS